MTEIDICSGLGQYLVEFLKIGTIFFIFVMITLLILLVQYKSYIQENWNQYRCNPLILPFSGYFGYDSSETFNYCISQIFSAQGVDMLKPFTFSSGLIGDILHSITDNIQDMRGFFNTYRNLYLSFAGGIMKRIEDSASTLQYLFTKMRSILERLWGVMVTMIYTGFTTVETMTSVFVGPIGGTAKFFCFDENMSVRLSNNTYKPIKHIQIGDQCSHGGCVLGVLQFISSRNMYLYQDKIIVSGSHFVQEDNQWIRIEDSPHSKYLPDYNKPYIYCLITEHNLIHSIDNILFKDYIETNDDSKNAYIKYVILNQLNHTKDVSTYTDFEKNYNSRFNYYESGFSEDTNIVMNHKRMKKIKDIRIGDKLENGLRVIGIIQQYCYSYYIYKHKIKISGNQIIFDDKHQQWILLKDVEDLIYSNTPILLYHLCVEKNGNLNIDNLFLSRDYQEIDDSDIDDLDDIILH